MLSLVHYVTMSAQRPVKPLRNYGNRMLDFSKNSFEKSFLKNLNSSEITFFFDLSLVVFVKETFSKIFLFLVLKCFVLI